ncbi:MAG TPA: PAS domain S-box protein [Dehalococcoidia bacterium]|nr:PAS domain S-box protein [Dehalococcoidia bacterium]
MKHLTVLLRNPHFWLLLVYFFLCIVLHYAEFLPFIKVSVSSLIGLERHSVERILFLALIALGGFAFGLRGGLIYLGLAFIAMLPRIILISSYAADALFETIIIVVIGGGIVWWIESRRREVGRREQALLKLEAVRRELQSYIQTIRQNEKRLSVLHSVTTAVNQSTSLAEVLETAVDRVREAVNADGLIIFLLEEETNELVIKAHQGISDRFASQVNRLKIGEGFNGWVAETGEPALIKDSSSDPRLSREVVREEGTVSQYIVPLKSKDRVVGTLCAVAYSERQFMREEQQLLMLIGTELGVAVEKAALGEESKQAGERYRELFEKAHDAIWVQDSRGNIQAANQAVADYTGYSIEELLGTPVTVLLRPEGLELARDIRRKLLTGENVKQPYEQTVKRKDGSLATIMLTTSLIGEEGSPPVFQHISRDVTREKLLQKNLHLYARQITRAHEEERKRIARELHDDSIQALSVLSRHVDDLITSKRDGVRMKERLGQVRKEVDGILSRIRRYTQDLRPPTLDYLGLLPALRELVSKLELQSGISSAMSVTGDEHHFAPEDELMIYRLVQESLNNVWRHSQAKKVNVTITFGEDKTSVEIRDDGVGFEMEEDMKFVQAGKIGLAGMQERADLLGGVLYIYSRPGEGTRVVLEVPSKRWTA